MAKSLLVRLLALFVGILHLEPKEVELVERICHIAIRKMEESRVLVIVDKEHPIGTQLSASGLVSRLLNICDEKNEIERMFVEKL